MRGDGDSINFLQLGGQFVETISSGLGGKGYLDCLPQEPDCLVPMKCMGGSWRCSFGSYILAVDAQRARLWHFGTLTFIPLQFSHLSMAFSNLLQLSGPSLMRQVSFAYWRRWFSDSIKICSPVVALISRSLPWYISQC